MINWFTTFVTLDNHKKNNSNLKQANTWQFILNSLEKNLPVALLYVVKSSGSSPGRQGFMMSVDVNGNLSGSIGGGIMEHKLVEFVKKKLKHDKAAFNMIKKQVHSKEVSKNQSGMICSGEQTIVLLSLDKKNKTTIKNIISCLLANNSGILSINNNGIKFSKKDSYEFDHQFILKDNNEFVYSEKLGLKNTLHIIGGGHCSFALSKIASELNYRIIIYEERDNLNTIVENKHAHSIVYLDSFESLGKMVPSSDNSYVVIMTIGYRTDLVALKSVINKRYKYLGVLGSKKKIANMKEECNQIGISKKKLESIFMPIGINIKSETPSEIAISIAAQLISIKNKS